MNKVLGAIHQSYHLQHAKAVTMPIALKLSPAC